MTFDRTDIRGMDSFRTNFYETNFKDLNIENSSMRKCFAAKSSFINVGYLSPIVKRYSMINKYYLFPTSIIDLAFSLRTLGIFEYAWKSSDIEKVVSTYMCLCLKKDSYKEILIQFMKR